MAEATTQEFDELAIQIEEPATSGTWITICGLVDATVTRSAQIDETEVPDCDDESLPLSKRRSVRNVDISISGTGVWAQDSHGYLMDWFYSSAQRNIRVWNKLAAVGDTEFETGNAFLQSLSNERTKGQVVRASVEIVFDGTPTRTAATSS